MNLGHTAAVRLRLFTIGGRVALIAILATPASTVAAAQNAGAAGGGNAAPPRTLTAESLAALPLPSTSATSTEMTVRWSLRPGVPLTSSAGSVPADNQFDLVGSRPLNAPAVRERDPRLNPNEIVIIVADAAGQAIGWQRVKDPRTVRAESPGPDGVLTGQTLRFAETELVFALPDDARAAQLQFYQPVWTGQTFALAPLGAVELRAR